MNHLPRMAVVFSGSITMLSTAKRKLIDHRCPDDSLMFDQSANQLTNYYHCGCSSSVHPLAVAAAISRYCKSNGVHRLRWLLPI